MHLHPMNSGIGSRGCRAADQYTRKSDTSDVSLKNEDEDGERSIIAQIQFGSDKSQTFLRGGALTIYALYMTVLNFIGEVRR